MVDEPHDKQPNDKPLWPAGQPNQTPQPAPQPQQQRQRIKLFRGLRESKKYVLKASILILIFWFIEFSYQYRVLVPGSMQISLLRSFALSGATLISMALIIGPVAKLTRHNYIVHRRTLGVWGFTFIIMHMLSVLAYIYNFNLGSALNPPNPFINPPVFGAIAFLIFLPIYLTSTDWAVDRLGFKKWKKIHRLVYFAYIIAVLHYTLVSPRWFENPANFLLLVLTVVALLVQVLAFFKTIKKTHEKKAAIIGLIIILFGAVMFYLAYFR